MTGAFFSTGVRQGDARSPGALARILRWRKWPVQAASAEQVHGTRLQIVPALSRPKKYHGTDGLLTEEVGQPVAVFTADCVPVFISGDRGRVVGMLHAGWRGVQGQILPKAVRLLRRRWRIRPTAIDVWAGPSIGACCFTAGWDVARYFPSTRRRLRAAWRVDLAGELRAQAKRLRIRWLSKKPSPGCTMHGFRHFSYRRDKTAKRQVSVIMKREES